MHLHSVNFYQTVGRKIFAFEVGVDRHLKFSASTDGRYEVDGGYATLLAHQFNGIRSDIKLHTSCNDSVRTHIPNLRQSRRRWCRTPTPPVARCFIPLGGAHGGVGDDRPKDWQAPVGVVLADVLQVWLARQTEWSLTGLFGGHEWPPPMLSDFVLRSPTPPHLSSFDWGE